MKFGSADSLNKKSVSCIKIDVQEQRIALYGEKGKWKSEEFQFLWHNMDEEITCYLLIIVFEVKKHLIDWLKIHTDQINKKVYIFWLNRILL